MTRVLQVSRSVIDGGFDYHAEIARAFTEKGASVLTVFQRGTLDAARESAFPGRVICLDARHRRRFKQRSLFALALWRLTSGEPIELAICHHLTPAQAVSPLLRLGRVRRACLVVHDYDYFDPADDEGRKRRRLLQRMLSHPWAVVGVSGAICRNVQAQVPELTAERCRVIPNAIDLHGLRDRASSRAAARKALGLEADAFVFGTVGRLVAFKAHGELIDAFASIEARMPDARLIIVGRGPLQAQLGRQVCDLGLEDRVTIRGFVDDAARHLSALDVFVLPSHNEPFGLVVLEAMACRIPVIASDSGGPAEILPLAEQLFLTGDRQALAQRMLGFYRASDTERDRLAEIGYRRALEGFRLRHYHDAYASLLDPDAQGWP